MIAQNVDDLRSLLYECGIARRELTFLQVEIVLQPNPYVATEKNCRPGQLALAWLLAKPVVSSIIVGASKVAQLEDNLGAVNITLTQAEIAELDSLTAPAAQYPGWFSERTVDPVHKKALQ